MESPGTLIAADCANTATRQLIAIRPIAASPMAHAVGRWSGWWQAVLAHRARKQTVVALSELDADMLRDIGVPESLLYETEATRRLEENRRAFWLWT
ncbi:hypothetical protein BOTU111921_26910 [Bordetella tumbae]|uniref:DUF1127 domain-containing protein n=1 Tax=Bordetella tumbae TaxID=1649139 RepID=UPI0039EE52E4